MKRFFIALLFALLVLPAAVRAQSPDDTYVSIYNIIQDGDNLNDKGQTAAALAKYTEAQSQLKAFQSNNPDWNNKVVKYRLKYLATKIAELSTPPPAPSGTNAPAAPATNAPANSPPSTASSTPLPTDESAPKTETPPAQETPPAKPPGPSAAALDLQNQIKNLQEQIRNTESDKALLQAKLKEALSAQPAALDPQDLVRAEKQIRELEKKNALLQAQLDQAQTNSPTISTAEFQKAKQSLADANQKVAQLNDENIKLALEKEALQARVKQTTAPDDGIVALRDENEVLKKQLAELQSAKTSTSGADELSRQLKEAQAQIAALQSDKEVLRLEKVTLEDQYKKLASAAPAPAAASSTPIGLDGVTADKIAQLEAQRDALQKTVDAVTKDLYGRKKGKAMAERIDEMTREIGGLHSRLEVAEASRLPYSAEELALMSQPTTTLMATVRSDVRKAVRELPASAAAKLDDAKRLFIEHDYTNAETEYLQVLKLDQKNVAVLADLASIELELGHMSDAEKDVKKALSVEPNDDYSLYVLGQIDFRQKKYDDAFEALSRAAQINPQNARVQNFLGLTLSEKGMRGPAETAFRRAIQDDPGFGQAHANLAVVYITQQPPLVELAKWHYQKALAAGQPPNPALEKLLDPTKNLAAGH